jgi:hypothetical protein
MTVAIDQKQFDFKVKNNNVCIQHDFTKRSTTLSTEYGIHRQSSFRRDLRQLQL